MGITANTQVTIVTHIDAIPRKWTKSTTAHFISLNISFISGKVSANECHVVCRIVLKTLAFQVSVGSNLHFP